jgi:hypothetical protein
VIHRDIKPGNLMLDREGVVRVLDMGLARFAAAEGDRADAAEGGLTSAGHVMGTVDFMAPEQAVDSRNVDGRADIYSLGCTLYFLLVGRPPTPDGSLPEKLLWHQSGPLPSLRELRPDIPGDLEAVFRRMVARRPDDRYPAFDLVIRDLEICLGRAGQQPEETIDLDAVPDRGVGGSARDEFVIPELVGEDDTFPRESAGARTQIDPPRGARPAPRRSQWSRQDRQMWIVFGGVVAAALLLSLVLWSLSGPPGGSQSSANGSGSSGGNSTTPRMASFNEFPPAGSTSPATRSARARTSEPDVSRSASWDPLVRPLIEELFPNGVAGGAGRNLYSDISTAIDTNKEGDWLIGRGLTRDGQPHHIRVRAGKCFNSLLSAQREAQESLAPQQVSRSIDSTFRIRQQQLVTLSNPVLLQSTKADGTRRIWGFVSCKIDESLPVEDVALVMESLLEKEGREGTRQSYQHLEWTSPVAGTLNVEMELDEEVPANFDVQLYLTAFVYAPKPSVYRISNELRCTLTPSSGQ